MRSIRVDLPTPEGPQITRGRAAWAMADSKSLSDDDNLTKVAEKVKAPHQIALKYWWAEKSTIPVEMEDPFTKMCQNFFSFLSHTQQRGYVIATTQALSFSFFPPFSTTVVCVCSTVLLEFPNHPQEFPNQPTPMMPITRFLSATIRKSTVVSYQSFFTKHDIHSQPTAIQTQTCMRCRS